MEGKEELLNKRINKNVKKERTNFSNKRGEETLSNERSI